LGYVHYGILGATLAGFAFVLPSFLMVVALGWAYINFGGLSWMQAVFYAVGSSVIGIIAFSAYKLTHKTIGRDKEHHWLTDNQFLDAVAVAMITPGPVVITTGFIGNLVAGFSGASIAAAATFLPAYLLTIIPAPFFKKYGKRPGLAQFVSGVTAAASGAIAGAVIVLGKRSIIDVPTLIFAVVTLSLMWRVKKVSEPYLVHGAALIGLLVYPYAHP